MRSPHSYVPWGLLNQKKQEEEEEEEAKHTLAGEICYSESRDVRMCIIASFAFRPLAPELFYGVFIFLF